MCFLAMTDRIFVKKKVSSVFFLAAIIIKYKNRHLFPKTNIFTTMIAFYTAVRKKE